MRVGDLTAVGTAAKTPKAPVPKSQEERAKKLLGQLRAVGPGDQSPLVYALKQLDPEVVLSLVEGEFPGLLWFHRHVSHRKLPLGRNVGPLGALLWAFGEDAVPLLVSILDDGHADQRYYAALIASDLAETISQPSAERLVESLGQRLFDGDTQVRDVSLHALREFDKRGLIAELGVRLVRFAEDPAVNIGTRIISLRALGVLRHVPSVRGLIPLLRDRAREIRDATRQVLRAICVEDRGSMRWRWKSWFKKHHLESRNEWLLRGLMHRDRTLRELAYQDLKRLVGEVPYNPDGPRAERKQAQSEYEALMSQPT